MRTTNGYGPLDPDPLTEEEVPPGQVRDFLGDLVKLPKRGEVTLADGQTLEADIEIVAGSSGEACLIINDEEVGQVLYVKAVNGGLELTVAHSKPLYNHITIK